MNWTKDALFSKAKLFIDKAAEEDKDSPFYGIFSALALELLSRAALANISPTLLAETGDGQRNIVYALGLPNSTSNPKSITVKQVLALCKELIPDFNADLLKLAQSMTDRRNEELHSGGAAFSEYNQDLWIGLFYKACKVLAESMGESLVTFLGKKRAIEAEALISENDGKVIKDVRDRISYRKKTYEEDLTNDKAVIEAKIEQNRAKIFQLVHEGFHMVKCPCCGHDALIYGTESTGSHDVVSGDVVIEKHDVIPSSFRCYVCGLKLTSYAELQAADLPLHYTNTYEYDPIEYFGIDVEELTRQHLEDIAEEYSNE